MDGSLTILVSVRRALVTLVAALLVPCRPAAAADTQAKNPMEVSPIPLSTFEIPTDPEQGRDPFFPRSTRLFAGQSLGTNAAPAARLQVFLRGLAGPAQNRLATLRTTGNPPRTLILGEGEEASVPAPGGQVLVRCVQIQDDRVVVELNGVRQELRLREGF